jgi:hypothetical protein
MRARGAICFGDNVRVVSDPPEKALDEKGGSWLRNLFSPLALDLTWLRSVAESRTRAARSKYRAAFGIVVSPAHMI